MESRVLRLSCQKCHRVQTSSRSPLWPADQMRFCRCFSAGAYPSDISTNTQSYTVLCIKSGAFENLRGLESISSAVEGSFHTRRPRRSGLGHRCLRDSRNSQGSVVGASRSRNLDFLQTMHAEGSWLKTITV